jgi:hypothetical protein
MPLDQPLFRFPSHRNEEILPTLEQLHAFLDSPKSAGRMETHRDDLKHYDHLFTAVEDFKQAGKQGGREPAFEEMLYYGVLLHARLFTPELRSAVEHFKYYRNALSEIDLKKPTAFIRAAEEEISRLKPGKREDAPKIERLRRMIDERKKELEAQKKRWPALRTELSTIALSIRDEIGSIRKLCESSIATLVDLQVGKKAESQMIEDIKGHFKDQVRDSLQHGPVTKEYLESMKATVARLSKQISLQLLEDIYIMTGLYEAVHDRAGAFAARLDPLVSQIDSRPQANLDDDKEFFARMEQELVAILSDVRIEFKSPADVPKDTDHEKILLQKRRDMLGRLFALLKS